MKKVLLPLVCLPLLVLALSETSYGWQGRMSGMGDPYGLVADESDFLIHTADIADGKGITYYGNYSLTYTKVTDWNYHMNWLTTGGVLEGSFNYDGDGHEYKHSAQFGVAFPLADPVLTLFNAQGQVVARNDNWSDTDPIGLAAAMQQVGAFSLPAASKDAAVLLDLPAGVYSVQATGATNATGVTLIEIYLVH